MATTTPEPIQQQPPKLRKVFDYLKGENKIKSESYEDFEQRMQDPAKLEKVYNYLKENNKVKAESLDAFQEWAGLKKKEHALPGGIPVAQAQTPQFPLDLDPPSSEESLTGSESPKAPEADLPPLPPLKSPEDYRFEFEQRNKINNKIDQTIRDFVIGNEKRYRPEDYPEKNPLVSFGKSIWNVFSNQIPSALASTAAALSETPPMMSGMQPLTDYEKELNVASKKALLEYAQGQQSESAEYTKHLVNTLDKVNDPIDALNYVFSAAGSATGQIPLSLVTGGTSSAVQEIGSIYLSSVNNIAKERGLTVNQVIDQNLDEPAYALAYGVAAGVLDRIGAGKVMSSFSSQAFKKSLRGRALTVTEGMAIEGVTEYGQTGLEQLGAQQGSGKSFYESLKEVVSNPEMRKERIEGFVQGIIGGSALSASGAGISSLRNRLSQRPEQTINAPEGDLGQPQAEPAPTPTLGPDAGAYNFSNPVNNNASVSNGIPVGRNDSDQSDTANLKRGQQSAPTPATPVQGLKSTSTGPDSGSFTAPGATQQAQQPPLKTEWSGDEVRLPQRQTVDDIENRRTALYSKKSTPQEKFDFVASLPVGTIIEHDGEQRIIIKEKHTTKRGTEEFELVPQVFNEDTNQWEDNHPAVQILSKKSDGTYYGDLPTVFQNNTYTDANTGERIVKSPKITLPGQQNPEAVAGEQPITNEPNGKINQEGRPDEVRLQQVANDEQQPGPGSPVPGQAERPANIAAAEGQNIPQAEQQVPDNEGIDQAPDIGQGPPRIEDITDPDELASMYVEEVNNPSVAHADVAIAGILANTKVKRKSFIDNDDEANITPGMAKSYFDKKDRGTPLDLVAKQASEAMNPMGDGTEISEQDVADFMKRYKSGPATITTPSGNPRLAEIANQYSNVTGKAINRRTAEQAVKRARKVKANRAVFSDSFLEVAQMAETPGALDWSDPDIKGKLTSLFGLSEEEYIFLSNFYGQTEGANRQTGIEGGAEHRNSPVANAENEETPVREGTEVSQRPRNAIESTGQEEVVREIKSKSLTHVHGLNMGSGVVKGTYLSTEENNRYATPGAQVSSAEVDISNPKVFTDEDDITTLRNSIIRDNIDKFELADFVALERPDIFEVNIDFLSDSGIEKLAEMVRDEMIAQGYDAVYFRESPMQEGELVVFDRSKVKLTPIQSQERNQDPKQPPVSRVVDKPEMEYPIHGVTIGGQDYYLQRMDEMNSGSAWYEVEKHPQHGWMMKRHKDGNERFLGFNKKEAIDALVAKYESPSDPEYADPEGKPQDAEEIVKHNSRRQKPIGIVGDPSSGFMFMTDLADKIVGGFKKWMTSKGHLPHEVFNRWISAKGEISAYEAQIRFTISDFKKAVKSEYDGKLTDAQITDLNLYLSGKKPSNPIPPETAKQLDVMRAQIDNLSRRFINEGVISGDLTATFTKNLGVYLTRSYRKHDDPFWSEFVDPQVRNKAEAFIRNNSQLRAQKFYDRAKRLTQLLSDLPNKLQKLRDRQSDLQDIILKIKQPKKLQQAAKMRDQLIQKVELRIMDLERKLKNNAYDITKLEGELLDLLDNGSYYEFIEATENYLDDIDTIADKIDDKRQSIQTKNETIKKLEDRIQKTKDKFTNQEADIISHATQQHANIQKVINKISTRDYRSEIAVAQAEGDRLFNITPEEIDGLVNYIMHEPEAPTAVLSGSKLGSKDLSILKKRGDIAPEIRALMGEYSDPLVNYARSVTKMASLIAKHHFLNEVRAKGMGKFLFDRPTGKYFVKLAAEGSKTMAPLNGLYTSKELAEAFNEFNSQQNMAPWLKLIMKAIAIVKANKTVASVQTHARNIVGNSGFIVMNGHWRFDKMGKAVQVAWAQLYNSDQAIRDKFTEYIKLGIVQDSAAGGELRALVNDVRDGKDFFERVGERSLGKVSRKVMDVTQKAYQAEDDMFKIFAFENELARYRKAYPSKTEEEIKLIAAQIVRNTYPTYSMVPKLVQALRHQPLVGSFVSWPAEVLRCTYNSLDLAIKESLNSETRAIAAQRIPGIMMAMILPTIGSMVSRHALGLDGEDDDDLRKFVAPWQKDSEFIYMNVDMGKYTIIDLGYSDPHNYLKRPIYQFLAGEDLLDGGIEAMQALARPFLDENLLTARIIDIKRNQKESGDHVYNEDAGLGDKLAAGYNHLWPVTEPGTMASIRRMVKGARGESDKYGNEYEFGTELISMLTGQKEEIKDIGQSYLYRVFEIKDRIDATEKDFYRVSKNNEATENQKAEAKRVRDAAIKRIVEDAKDIYLSAIRLGVDAREARKSMIRYVKNIDIIRAIKEPEVQKGVAQAIKKQRE